MLLVQSKLIGSAFVLCSSLAYPILLGNKLLCCCCYYVVIKCLFYLLHFAYHTKLSNIYLFVNIVGSSSSSEFPKTSEGTGAGSLTSYVLYIFCDKFVHSHS